MSMDGTFDIVVADGKGTSFVKLLKEFYQKEAIFSAANIFADKFYIKIDSLDLYVGVWFLKKQTAQTEEDIKLALLEFCNEVIDQQIKLDLQKQYGDLRSAIYRYAFEPIE